MKTLFGNDSLEDAAIRAVGTVFEDCLLTGESGGVDQEGYGDLVLYRYSR